MEVLINIVIVAACILGLWFGANWVVDSATRVARKIGMSDLVIGLTIVAVGTSAPEFAVTASAALGGQPDISVGNIVGSNIFNLGFILGGLALFGGGITSSRPLVYRDGSVLIGTTLILWAFLFDLELVFWEGVVLLVLLIVYIVYLVNQRADVAEELSDDPFRPLDVPLLILGLALVIVSANFFVDAASNLARFLGVSEWVIGVTIVAFGTSAPEIATSAVALLRGQTDMSAGNLIGSNLFNLLGVLGLGAVLAPIGALIVDPDAQESIYALVAMCTLVVVMMRTRWHLSRVEGGVLLTIGFVWLVAIALFSGPP